MAKKTHEQFMKELYEKNPHANDIKIKSNYNGAREKIDCECLIDGHEWSPLAGNLLKNHGCPECAIRRRNEANTKTHEQFMKELYEKNPYSKDIIIKSDYNGIEERMDCECKICGYEWSPTADSLLNGKRGCPICGYKRVSKSMSIRMKGRFVRENNPNWNPNLTDKEREDNRDFLEYEEWRTQVYKKDNYTCQCCGKYGGKLNAHHKDGYNWCIERRVDVTNGVTLCEDCHKEFHSIYGYKDNTEEQYNEFINNKNLEDRDIS